MAIVASVVVGAVTSKLASAVITRIAEDSGVGILENNADLLGSIGGIVAGAWAGGATYDSMTSGPEMVAERAAEGGEIFQAENTFASGAQATPLPDPDPIIASPIDMTGPAARTGDIPSVTMPPAAAPTTAAGAGAAAPSTFQEQYYASKLAEEQAAANAPWYEKMWNSESMMTGIGSGVGNIIAQSGAPDPYAQQEEIREKYYDRWKDYDVSQFDTGRSYQSMMSRRPRIFNRTPRRRGMLTRGT